MSEQSVILSLTSYPKRIQTVHETIRTLLNQTVKAPVILWLADTDFPNKMEDLPKSLTDLLGPEFEIRWTKDLRSFTKLIPALEAFPEACIITYDDDILYEPDNAELLQKGYREKPDCIQTHRVTTLRLHGLEMGRAVYSNKKVYPAPAFLHTQTGVLGCLYPPHALHPEVMREDLFMKLAPTNDDLWFWLMGVLNGTRVNVARDTYPTLNYVPGTQEVGLWHLNITGDKLFYTQLENLLAYYPVVRSILSYEQTLFQEMGERKKADKRVKALQKKLERVENSRSYRIGRAVTWAPRKVRGGLRCVQEHGMTYTLHRLGEQLKGSKSK